jgi:hypothetical protein
MHASTPLVMYIGSHHFMPGRKYTDMHYNGAYFISAALLLGLVRPIMSDWRGDPHTQQNETLYSLMYAMAAAMQGLINLYKEKTIIEWSYPINLYFISSCIFFYQVRLCLLFPLPHSFQISAGLPYPTLPYPTQRRSSSPLSWRSSSTSCTTFSRLRSSSLL